MHDIDDQSHQYNSEHAHILSFFFFFNLIIAYQTQTFLLFIYFCLYSYLLLFYVFLFFVFWRLFFSGGNFCAGYDLKELSQGLASLTLEQNVTQGPAPMVRGGT